MQRIATFEKVSFEQYKKDFLSLFKFIEKVIDESYIKEIYDNIKLPRRSTIGSAGYDFFMPYPANVSVGESAVIPTGIRCRMNEGWVLNMYPRSGHGFKYGVHLANTVGIIDQDYFFSDNEGHIMIKLVNDSALSNTLELHKHEAFCQGIFLPFGITKDDDAKGVRNGGFGSTDKDKEVQNEDLQN